MSIILDPRSSILDPRSSILDPKQVDTKLNTSKHVTPACFSHENASSYLATNQSTRISLNPTSNQYTVEPTALAIVLRPHSANHTEFLTNQIGQLSADVSAHAIDANLTEHVSITHSEPINTTITDRHNMSWLRIFVPVNHAHSKWSRTRTQLVKGSAFE